MNNPGGIFSNQHTTGATNANAYRNAVDIPKADFKKEAKNINCANGYMTYWGEDGKTEANKGIEVC